MTFSDPSRRARLLIAIGVVLIALALAWTARPQTETQAVRVDRLSSELRCVVCQGLSVKDSPAESARQMRGVVTQRVAEGRTDEQIRDEFRASYGDWVVLAPPLASWAGIVWLVPIGALLAGLAVAWGRLRAPPYPAAPEPSGPELAALRERVTREEAADAPLTDAT